MLFAMQRQMHMNQKVQRTVEIALARFADSVVDVRRHDGLFSHGSENSRVFTVASREENR